MIIQDYPHFCNMSEDMLYYRPEHFSKGFIEKSIIFILPDRLKKFRHNLWHVHRSFKDEGLYLPLFRVKTLLRSEATPEKIITSCDVLPIKGEGRFQGPYEIYPFYTKTARNQRRALDYYVLFLFRDRISYRQCEELVS